MERWSKKNLCSEEEVDSYDLLASGEKLRNETQLLIL